MSPLAERIHSALPQTQCTRCGFPDCAAYAEAIADGDAEINQCPPGGAEGIARIAAVTGRPGLPLNPANGTEGPRTVAVIDEAWCIGCTLCMPACPTDAIVGASKHMHTVIESCCTGCELCVVVCPVDCISLENATGYRTGWQAWSAPAAAQALQRYQFHLFKARQQAAEGAAPSERIAATHDDDFPAPLAQAESDETARKREAIEAALARSRARRQLR